MRRFAVAAVLPVLAVLLTGASGCVSAAKYRDLEASARNMEQRLNQAETENTDLRAKKRELEARLAAEQEKSANLASQVQTLQDARDRLQAAYDELRKQFDALGNQKLPDIQTVQALPQKLSDALEKFAQDNPGIVEFDRARGLLKWKSDLLFDLGSAQVKPDALPALAEFANILKSDAAQGFDIMIAGHTDNTRIGRPATRQLHPTNWHLSAHRAISVREVLEKDGVSPDRQSVMGYGEYQPVAPNAGDANKAQNRRVEIYLVKKGNVPGSTPAPTVAQPSESPVEATESAG